MRPPTKAFTLAELVIVLAILAIAAAVSFSAFTSARQGARFKEDFSALVDWIQDTRSKALSNATLNSSGETAEAFYLVVDSSVSPATMQWYADLPSPSSDEILDSMTFGSNFQITVAPADLERIEYHPPTGELELVFTSETSTGMDVTEVTFVCTDGRSTQTLYLNEISGVPEIVN